MHARRPPLAEVDTWALWLTFRRGQWRQVLPWLLLLGGFCTVLAAMASFFWLTARTDPVAVVGLLAALLVFSVYLHGRLSTRRGFALALVAALLTTAGLVFGIWLLVFWVSGESVWIGIVGVVIEGGLGLVLGLSGLNRLDPTRL